MRDTGANRILLERERQHTEEKWSAEHDDRYKDNELIRAAYCYLRHIDAPLPDDQPPSVLWPWDYEWWKPSDDPIRTLEKAGALIAAEIDRLLRLRKATPPDVDCYTLPNGECVAVNCRLHGECTLCSNLERPTCICRMYE